MNINIKFNQKPIKLLKKEKRSQFLVYFNYTSILCIYFVKGLFHDIMVKCFNIAIYYV